MVGRHPDQDRRGLLRGPSPGLLLWVAFVEQQLDWLIDARRRWHESAPARGNSWRVALGVLASVLATVAIVERLAGG